MATLVIRDAAGDVREIDAVDALQLVRHRRAILLTNEDARRFRTGRLGRVPAVPVSRVLTAEDSPTPPVKPKRRYRRRDVRAEA